MKTQKKRRKKNKTDYLARLKLLKSGKPRLVFRKTNKHLISQYVKSKEAKDKIIFGINSKKLFDYGWPKEFRNSLKTIPAAYLLGFLTGKEISEQNLENPVIDFGMLRTIRKSKLFAFLKGLNDSGIEIKCPEEKFPEEERIQGKHLKKDFSKSFNEIKSRIKK